ncbi:MAG: hypothetical protein D6689_09660 [Deltaproteobacteria bacterium]|nr:MAG: hypothetical protein D6689_09660 [Deltaproteobacteria bacterium]
MSTCTTLATIALACVCTACSPYDPELGDTPFRCSADEPRCPDDYVCVPSGSSPTGVCVRSGSGLVPDAGPDGSTAGCNDDSSLEPNDDLNQAYPTQIPGNGSAIAFASLAICPAGDVDLFWLSVDQNGKNIFAEVRDTDRARGELALDLLNEQGTSVSTGTYEDNATLNVRLANAPQGTYYVRVRGADPTVVNNYGGLYIETTGP